jgi:hypothetical protein
MIIQCAFPVSPNSIWDYAQKIGGLPRLPRSITKRSTCVIKQGALYQILILLEFDKSNFAEAMEYICKQSGSLADVSEFSISAHSYGAHPYFVKLEKGGEV